MDKTGTAKSIMSDTDKLQLENSILTKQNQEVLNKQQVKSIFDEEEQAWIEKYIKQHNLEQLLEMLDID